MSTLTRLPARLDADELEAALFGMGGLLGAGPHDAGADRTTWRGGPSRCGHDALGRDEAETKAARGREDGAGDRGRRTQAAPGHPWLDPAVIVDSAHRPARVALAVDGKERKLAKASAKTKVHLLGALVHHLGALIGQDRVAKTEKTNEITHFVPLLAPLPLTEVLITADAMEPVTVSVAYTETVTGPVLFGGGPPCAGWPSPCTGSDGDAVTKPGHDGSATAPESTEKPNMIT